MRLRAGCITAVIVAGGWFAGCSTQPSGPATADRLACHAVHLLRLSLVNKYAINDPSPVRDELSNIAASGSQAADSQLNYAAHLLRIDYAAGSPFHRADHDIDRLEARCSSIGLKNA